MPFFRECSQGALLFSTFSVIHMDIPGRMKMNKIQDVKAVSERAKDYFEQGFN
jgi:hypothetical protein